MTIQEAFEDFILSHKIDIYRLMVLMGHEDIETTKRYLHHANETICAKENISHLDKVYKTEN